LGQIRLVIECQLDPTLTPRVRRRRLLAVRDILLYHQARNETARRSHAKTKRKRLRERGIDLRKARRCPAKLALSY
jgi:hypothetical protein